MNRDIALRIIQAFAEVPATLIEYIPSAIGERMRIRHESTIDLGVDARRHQRRVLLTSALAVRVTDRLQPFGNPFQVFVKDVSASGLGFMHTRHWPECKLAIRLENNGLVDAHVFVIGTVRRSVCKSGVYEVGIEFSHNFRSDRLEALPEAPADAVSSPAEDAPAVAPAVTE